jgi:hypothetical protein
MPREASPAEHFPNLLQLCLSLARLTFDRVLGAVRDRIHVTGGPANGVAGGRGHRSADQGGSEDFLDHF